MKRSCRNLLVFVCAGTPWLLPYGFAAGATNTPDPAVLLESAKQTELVDGDLARAIEKYQAIAETGGVTRPVAAEALLRLAESYEKIGSQEARKAYQRVVTEFGDQRNFAGRAQSRLAALAAAAMPNVRTGTTVRKLTGNLVQISLYNVNRSGRFAGAWDNATSNAGIYDLTSKSYRQATDYGTWNPEKGFADVVIVSPDGKTLAFNHYNDGGIKSSIRVIGADGSGERTLYQVDDDDYSWIVPHDWSPDGKRILVSLEGQAKSNSAKDSAAQQSLMALALVSLEDGSIEILKTLFSARRFRDGWPRFSPDGKHVVYSFPPQPQLTQGDVYVLSIADRSVNVLAESPGSDAVVGWSPDGRSILLTSDRSGSTALWRQPVADGKPAGEPEMLRADMDGAGVLGFAENGALYYVSWVTTSNAYRTTINPGEAAVLKPPVVFSPRFTGVSATPMWSPDGSQTAFLGFREIGSPKGAVFAFESQQGVTRDVLPQVNLILSNHSPTWSSDEKTIFVFGQGRGAETRGVYGIDIQTGNASPLFAPVGGRHFDWTGDAKNIFQVKNSDSGDGRNSITMTDVATGDEITVYSGESWMIRALTSSPDGQSLAFFHNHRRRDEKGDWTIDLLNVRTGVVNELFRRSRRNAADEAPGIPWGRRAMTFTPDGRHLLFVLNQYASQQHPKGLSELMVVPTEGGEARPIGISREGKIDDLAFHPDGRQFAFSVAVNHSELWVMENFLPQSERAE